MLLVTGATGYLGSVLVARLAAEGREVRALVRTPAKAALLPSGVDVAVGELGDAGSLAAAVDGCEAVLHLAGAVGGTPEDIRAANVGGTRLVLDAMAGAGVRRLVHVSSSSAGMDASGLLSEHPTAPPALSDPYSSAKAEADRLVLAASVDASIVMPTSIYGPSPAGPYSYNALFLAAARGEITEIVDSPIGWVLVDDVAEAIALALDHGEPGRRYVLCGEVVRFGPVLDAVCAGLDSPHRVRTLPPGSTLGPDAHTFARRSEVYGHFPPVHIDDAGLRGLGLAPRGIEEGLTLTLPWLAKEL